MIIVVGDYIEDVYRKGPSFRLSPEAPVPVILNPKDTISPGGAANVVRNLEALGHDVEFVHDFKNRARKIRVYADNHLLCRMDVETYVEYKFEPPVIERDTQVAILSDYNKGVLHEPEKYIDYLNDNEVKVFVDPKKPFERYRNAFLIKANLKEFRDQVRLDFGTEWNQFDHSPFQPICEKYNIEHLVITLGAGGVMVYSRDGTYSRHGELNLDVVDVTGAGDVFIAVLAHMYNQGEPIHRAARIANDVAGISVTKPGTYCITKEDIYKVIAKRTETVFTNGCFDVLHAGHIHYLSESRKLGKKLVVGINSDASVKSIKGSSRPINDEKSRKAVLEALWFVDEVHIFDEDTPYELIKKLKPDIITKGSDYKPEEVVGRDLARVEIIPILPGHSSTRIINEQSR